MADILKFFRSRSDPEDIFHQLLKPHVELMYRMAYRWTGSQSEAEDLVQDVLVQLVQRLAEMQQVTALRPWLLRVVYNRYVDLYRRRKNSPVVDNSAVDNSVVDNDAMAAVPEPNNNSRQVELQHLLQQALQQLPPEQRDVVLLHDLEGYTAAEIADILDTNIGTVKSRLHRARDKLKQSLR